MSAALKLSSCRGLCSIPMAPGARIQLTAGVCQRCAPRAGTQVLDIALVVPETGEATDVSGCTGIGQVRYELGQMQGEGNSEATSHSFSWGWGLWGCVVLLCHVPPENRSHTVTPAPGGKGDMESSSSYHTSKKCPVNLWDDGHLGVVAQTLHGLRNDWQSLDGAFRSPGELPVGWLNPTEYQEDLTQDIKAAPLLPWKLEMLCYGMCFSLTQRNAQPVPRSSIEAATTTKNDRANPKQRSGECSWEDALLSLHPLDTRAALHAPPAVPGPALPPALGQRKKWSFHVLLCLHGMSTISIHNILATH